MTQCKARHHVEYGIYLIMALCIPLLQAPKNITFGLFALVWLINRIADRDFGGKWRAFDSVILFWWITNITVNLVSYYHGTGFSGAWDLLRYTSVMWMLSRSRLTEKQMIWVMLAFTIATMAGLVYAYYTLYVTHSNIFLKFKAVGQHNHTAIFIDLAFALTLSFLMAYWNKTNWGWKALGIIAVALMIQATYIGASRGAAIGMLLVFFVLALFWLKRNAKLSITIFVLLIIGAGAAFIDPPHVLKRQESWEKTFSQGYAPRTRIYHTALLSFKQHPIFGLGSHNYKHMTYDQIKQWAIKDTGKYDASYYLKAPHAHNLYLTTLADMGIVGLAGLLAFLIAWAVFLLKHIPAKDDPAIAWAVWAASLSAWLINVSIGCVNTTLHHEHALLSMSMLGLSLSYLYRRYHANTSH